MCSCRVGLRGYSLLELIIAFALLFIACAHLFSLYAFGTRAARTTKEATTAAFLAQEKMEEWQFGAEKLLGGSQEGFGKGVYSSYKWRAERQPFSEDFCLLTVSAWAPNSPKCSLRKLCPVDRSAPVSLHCYDSEVDFADGGPLTWQARNYWYDGLLSFKSVIFDENWHTSAMAGHPGTGLMWLADGGRGYLAKLILSDIGKFKMIFKYKCPQPKNGYSPVFAGIAADKEGNFVFCADKANRALWVLDDSRDNKIAFWTDSTFFTCKSEPLADLTSIACDQYGSTLWLCEGRERRLRAAYWGGAPPGGSYEKFGPCGYWGEKIVCPYKDCGILRAVAVNGWGSVIYTVDSSYLYCVIYKDNGVSVKPVWQRLKLPEKLRKAAPGGLCVDPCNSRLYINTVAGGLWLAVPKADGTLSAACLSELDWR
ncbi:hypothetical protein IJT93_00700 [bacterium]|nr:hypothetical protein [bacterium]